MFRKSLIMIILCLSIPAWAQQSENKPDVVSKYGPRRQIATIVYMGLGGAVLGLSTLSFYGRPQDKLSNIPIGFGVGVVIGTIYMTYQAATNPQEFYRSDYEYKPEWEFKDLKITSATDVFIEREEPFLNYEFTF